MTVQGADNWADAPTLPFGTTSTPTPSATLTVEASEPRNWLTRTGWWKVTVPHDCLVNFDLLQTAVSDPWASDTVITVYTGDTLAGLVEIASFDDSDTTDGYLSEGELQVAADTTLYVQVGLYSGGEDCDYLLRVCEAQLVPGDWFDVGNWTAKQGESGVAMASGSYGGESSVITAGAGSDSAYNQALTEAHNDALTYGGGSGYRATQTSTADPQLFNYHATFGEYAGRYSLAQYRIDGNGPFTAEPGHYDYEWQSQGSTVVAVTLHVNFVGAATNAISGDVSLRAVSNAGDFEGVAASTWGLSTMNIAATLHSASIAPGESNNQPFDWDVTPYLDDGRSIMFRTVTGLATISGSTGSTPAQTLNVGYGITGVTFELERPLVRYIDKVLIEGDPEPAPSGYPRRGPRLYPLKSQQWTARRGPGSFY